MRYEEFVGRPGLDHLKLLIGSSITWIYGPRFIVDGSLVVAPVIAFDIDRTQSGCHERFLVVRSERYETVPDGVDYYRFIIEVAVEIPGVSGDPFVLMQDVCALAVHGMAAATEVAFVSGELFDDDGSVTCDLAISIGDGRGQCVSIEHGPTVYGGVGVRLGSPLIPSYWDRSWTRLRL